ncbi:MAG TPA: CPBP family intramembrane glutamic endopeptidase [Desulfomonilia bacterium]
MDRRIIAILGVSIIEIAMRLFYKHLGIDPLLYTLTARLIQAALIIGTASGCSGIKTKSVTKETIIGIGCIAAFGIVVLSADLASRLAVHGGILRMLLKKQEVNNVFLFFIVGCLIGPFVEELFFRGLIQSLARQYMPAFAAIAVSSLFFASMHGSLSVVQLAGGIMFGIIYEWRGSIWAGYIFHVAANTGIWLYPYLWPFILSRI